MRRRRFLHSAPALAGVFAGAGLSGCAAPPQVIELLRAWPAAVPSHATAGTVPFYPQEDYECGPAALAMAASAAGRTVRPEQLVAQVYVPGRQGALQPEMLAAGRRQGLVAYPLVPRLDAVLREVAAGHPVIVFQNLSLPAFPVWHYAVVIAYDRETGLRLHSGRTSDMEISWDAFERTWARGGYWAMVLLPPQRLPATVEPERYLGAVAALERSDPRAAQAAYARALEAWPGHRLALFGAGNAAYALGQLEAAATSLRAAVDRYPDFADAWHNLAQVRLDQGRRQEAEAAIERAVALGGSRLSRYLELRQQIGAGGR